MSKNGIKLRDLAFQRRPEDYQEVIALLSELQERKINGGILDGDDYDGIDIAQAFLREVDEPKTVSN